MSRPNAIYIMSGGGTPVISSSAYGAINRVHESYRSRIGTFYASLGGARGVINEDITDVFRWAEKTDDPGDALGRLRFFATPVFGTSRHVQDEQDNQRILDVAKAHNIHYFFFNGGNDTMEKALLLKQYADSIGYHIVVIGVPKTVDNDILETHRCPGYASFAKQVAIVTNGLQNDMDSFGFQKGAHRNGMIKEGAVGQIITFMGRDHAWGALGSLLDYDEKLGPHAILSKNGGFDETMFLDRCQRAWDQHERLLVIASEGAFDIQAEEYIGYMLEVHARDNPDLKFKIHSDPHKNTSVTDSRVALYLKLLLEHELKIKMDDLKGFKMREEGPGYNDRSNLEIMSEPDYKDAVAVGEMAADLLFNPDDDEKAAVEKGVMVTLGPSVAETGYTPLTEVADPKVGSKNMTQGIGVLDRPGRTLLTPDGLMVDDIGLYTEYIEEIVDLNGPNRRELFSREGFSLPLRPIEWPLIDRLLEPHRRI
ncbi:MAG: 6-phosphofructokinase [Candidatus Woesearchaeota archaeon]